MAMAERDESHPPVMSCIVNDCEFWSENNMCRAKNIWVGGKHPTCDTYQRSDHHEARAARADIRQCDVNICTHNANAMCQAPGINVAWHSGHADCVTFMQQM